jgi:hypothetical protein
MTRDVSQQEIVAAYEQYGSKRSAAAALGIPRSSFQYRYSQAVKEGLTVSEGIRNSVSSAKLGFTEAKAGWIVDVDKETGSRRSTYWKAPQEATESLIDAIKYAFEGITPAPPIPPPQFADSELLTVYLLSDRHTGLMAWARETGEAYNTKIAVQRVKDWVARCVSASPSSHTALIIDNGDGQHADDQTNQTPRSKHGLDVDTRYFRTIEADIEALSTAVELAKAKHIRVIVRIMSGNHNPHSWIAILFALAERYRLDDRVEVICDPSEFFVMDWGKVLIAAHHGDKAKADRLVHFIADEFAEMWGKTRHRFLFTGHLHSHKSQDIGGMQWEQLRAVTARDAYAYNNAYVSRAQMQAITYDKQLGEISRTKVTA